MNKSLLKETKTYLYRVPIFLTLTDDKTEIALLNQKNRFAAVVTKYDEKIIGYISICSRHIIDTQEEMEALIQSAKANQFKSFVDRVTEQYRFAYPELKEMTFRYRLSHQLEYMGEGKNMVYIEAIK